MGRVAESAWSDDARPPACVGAMAWLVFFAWAFVGRDHLIADGRGWWVHCGAAGVAMSVVALAYASYRHRRQRRFTT